MAIFNWEQKRVDPELTSRPDSDMARDSFGTFIPLSVDNNAKSQIIFDFFDLLAAIVAHSKTNGFSGRKLSRAAAWWAFEHSDNGNGFEGGYKSWLRQVSRGLCLPYCPPGLLTRTRQRGRRHEPSVLCLSPLSRPRAHPGRHHPPAHVAAEAPPGNRIPAPKAGAHADVDEQGCHDCRHRIADPIRPAAEGQSLPVP